MISNICYAFVFLFECLISFYYFNFKYDRKISKWIILLSFSLTFVTLYGIHFLESPVINLVAFFICNFIIAKICYKTELKSAIFSNLILTFLMFITELIVLYSTSIFLGTELFANFEDDLILIIYSVFGKLFYFLAVHLIIKISQKESTDSKSKYSLALCILPIASIVLMYTTVYLCIAYSVNSKFKLAIVTGNILLLFANIVVFYINELTIRVNKKYTEIQLSKQQEKDTIDYYELLREQNENSRVLIHDITKHLNTIKQLTEDKNSDITKYISDIVDDFSVMNPVDYCSNPIVNLITHRYYEICKKYNITFTINTNNANIDFMKEHDITALLDNLLENAVEATLNSDEKFIDFSIVTRNSNFVIIKILNSCAKQPNFINGVFISSKNSPDIHGIGTRSIKRVVSKYNGNLDMNYDSNTNTFTSVICINTNLQNLQ